MNLDAPPCCEYHYMCIGKTWYFSQYFWPASDRPRCIHAGNWIWLMHHMETLSTGVQSLWLFVYWYSLNREMNFATLRAPTSHGNLISLMATSVILLKQPSSLWWFLLGHLGLVPISQNPWKIPFWSILRDRSPQKCRFSQCYLWDVSGCFTSKMTHFDTDRCIFVVPSLKLT